MNMEPRKQAIIAALRAFANQRPGLDPRNYISHGMDNAGRAAYRAEVRSITKDLHHARELMRAVELADGITADDLHKASMGAYSGRLTIKPRVTSPDRYGFSIDYCTGQYWPTEYRRAVCAVLASALWEYTREKCMPQQRGDGTYEYTRSGRVSAVSAGDWLRAHFRQQFGRGIASRWFS
jgi:hypothetical protein